MVIGLKENLSKDENILSEVVGFLHLITGEKSLIPLKFFPYFIVSRLYISEAGQIM